MFINISNHNSEKWTNKQKKEAKVFGEIVDLGFPAIAPSMNEEIDVLVSEYIEKVRNLTNNMMAENVIMVQGEFTFTYRLVSSLKNAGFVVVCACTERKAVETVDGEKIIKQSIFEFAGFRRY